VALGIPVVARRASDLMSMWVGETEKEIRRAFEEAERDGALLLVDEADSLLSSRNRAHHRFEVSQTNEVLTQLETFSGVCVFTSNRLHDLDEASIRRFQVKARFGPLRSDQVLDALARYFGNVDFNADDERQLKKLTQLTLGDIRAAAERMSLGPAGGHSASQIIAELANEQSHKRDATRPVGF